MIYSTCTWELWGPGIVKGDQRRPDLFKWVVITLTFERSEGSIIFHRILCHFNSYEAVDSWASHVCAQWICTQERYFYFLGDPMAPKITWFEHLKKFLTGAPKSDVYSHEPRTLDELKEAIRDKTWLQSVVRWLISYKGWTTAFRRIVTSTARCNLSQIIINLKWQVITSFVCIRLQFSVKNTGTVHLKT